jgi:hypothetical protein
MAHLNPAYPGQVTTHPDGLRLRTWLIQESSRGKDLRYGNEALANARANGAPSETIQVMQAYTDENARLASHDAEFNNVCPNHEIIGQQGCGDLTMNLWNVAYLNSPLARDERPTLIFPHKEPLAGRTYSCLVKWKPKGDSPSQMTIEDVQFDPNAESAKGMVWVKRDGQSAQRGDEIEFAVSNQQVIRAGQILDISRFTHEFSDLRHLLQMPNLNPKDTLPITDETGAQRFDTGRPRFYFGRATEDDIWLGEAQLIHDVNLQRAAMMGPVFLSRLYEGLGVSVEQMRGAMVLAGYQEITDPRKELDEGEYRFVREDDTQVEVYLRRNTYGWTMIGLTEKQDKLLCLACEGNPARREGHVLEKAACKLRQAGAHNALLIDEGADVFQVALLGHNLPKVKVAGNGPELDVTVPLKRTRLRATFIFARRKVGDGVQSYTL